MAKYSEKTAAGMAHAPETVMTHDQPHAHKYPGRSTPKAEKVRHETSHDAAALKAGRSNSMGVSANGSHKGLPCSMEHIGKQTEQPGDDAHAYARNYPGRAYSKK
jgi:hypothetical protein